MTPASKSAPGNPRPTAPELARHARASTLVPATAEHRESALCP